MADEKANFAIVRDHVLNLYFPDINIFMEIDNITASKRKPQVCMIKGDPGNHGIFFIPKVNLPFIPDPGEPATNPYAETAVFALDMIFLPHMGKIEFADIIVMVKRDEKLTVSNRDISWHSVVLLKSG